MQEILSRRCVTQQLSVTSDLLVQTLTAHYFECSSVFSVQVSNSDIGKTLVHFTSQLSFQMGIVAFPLHGQKSI